MSVTIQRLPSVLVNQIAAGEVIERPASVVKELLENSLDAHANHIQIDINFGGLNAIIVRDNGDGIDENNLPLAVAPHATSKIEILEDLFNIKTMGFRGEALASIASVSYFSIQSKTADQVHAWELLVHEGIQELRPCARERGTTVAVRDLFYNTPVRKKFLGSERTEFLAIDRVVRCFALAAPWVNLEFYHQGQRVFQVAAGDTKAIYLQRLQKILGKQFVSAAMPVFLKREFLCIQGYVASPDYVRSQQDRLWIYVNRRMVNDKLLTHAVKQAFAERLPAGRFPCCLLEIEIDPAEVDVNVHPTKHELRFHQPRWVHDAVREAVESALGNYHASILQKLDNDLNQSLVSTEGQDLCPQARNSSWANVANGTSSHVDWLDLNPAYALLSIGRSRYLLHTIKFYQCFLEEQMQITPLPWEGRPLLVPVSIEMPGSILYKDEFLTFLAQFGLTFSWVGGSKLVIRSTPVMMPYLDLKPAIIELFLQKDLNFEKIKSVLSRHQYLDASLLSEHDKQSWMAYLAQKSWSTHAAYLKLLSIENCAVLFNAS